MRLLPTKYAAPALPRGCRVVVVAGGAVVDVVEVVEGGGGAVVVEGAVSAPPQAAAINTTAPAASNRIKTLWNTVSLPYLEESPTERSEPRELANSLIG